MTEKYKLSDDGQTITDSTTGLMWAVETLDAMTQADAFQAAKESTLSGHSDWRVPTVRELQSIVDHSRSNPACALVFRAKSAGYWTSTDYAPVPAYAWLVYFVNGGTNANYKTYDFFVRLVRSGQ